MSVRIDYDKSIKRIHRRLSSNTEIHRKAVSYFSDVLSVFHDKITVLLVKQSEESSNRDVNIQMVQTLLHRILRPALATRAIEVGRIAVHEYDTGKLVYIDKSELKNDKERFQEIDRGGPFMRGVMDLLNHLDVKCTIKCQRVIAQILLIICRDILKKSYHGQSELKTCDAQRAIKQIFGVEMFHLASNEGEKSVYYYKKKLLIVPKPSSLSGMSKTDHNRKSFMDGFLVRFVDKIHSEVNRSGRFTEVQIENAAKLCLPEEVFNKAMLKAYKDRFLSTIEGQNSRSSFHRKELSVNPTNSLHGYPNSPLMDDQILKSEASKIWLCSDFVTFCSTYLQGNGWDCPYRNAQILISSLIRNPLYKGRICTGNAYVPCITEIQGLIQNAWREGFDPEGSNQLEGRILNTRKWIGATEIVTLLSFLGIRTKLIDFYTATGPCQTHPEMLLCVQQYFTSEGYSKPPIYMQSDGISKTIIGLEQLHDGSLQLLILDPCHRKSHSEQFKNASPNTNAMRLQHIPCSQLNAQRYQLVLVHGICETEQEYEHSKTLKSLRIPPTE